MSNGIEFTTEEWAAAHEPFPIITPEATIRLKNVNSLSVDEVDGVVTAAESNVKEALVKVAHTDDDAESLARLPLSFLLRVFTAWRAAFGVDPGESETSVE